MTWFERQKEKKFWAIETYQNLLLPLPINKSAISISNFSNWVKRGEKKNAKLDMFHQSTYFFMFLLFSSRRFGFLCFSCYFLISFPFKSVESRHHNFVLVPMKFFFLLFFFWGFDNKENMKKKHFPSDFNFDLSLFA